MLTLEIHKHVLPEKIGMIDSVVSCRKIMLDYYAIVSEVKRLLNHMRDRE